VNWTVESAGWLSEHQASLLRMTLCAGGIDKAKFAQVFGVESIDQIQREHINRAVLLIELIREGVST
jgi:hypothetical protein